jgi:type VI secretion system protein ImpJ
MKPEVPFKESWVYRSKVMWSEGMYLRPQHFQQLERYFEHYVQHRSVGHGTFFWGLLAFELDRSSLALGKVSLMTAQGVFPDGTPFKFDSSTDAPAPFDVPVQMRDELVVLAMPVRRHGTEDMIYEERRGSLARYSAQSAELADAGSIAVGPAVVQLGKLRLRLMRAAELTGEWLALGVVRVVERRTDNQLVLDANYLPPMLAVGQHPVLDGFVREIHGLLEQRAAVLAHRQTQVGRAGVGEVVDFLMLELVNRAQADTWHAQNVGLLHPEGLFRDWLRLAFDLSAFTSETRRPPVWPVYQHDDLQSSFGELMSELRRSLSTVLEQNAVAIPLLERAQRVWVAQVSNADLLREAAFVLAVRADLPSELVRSRYPAQVKIGPVERLHDLVHLQLPGIGLRMLPVAPRQIPYHAGHHYFELDTECELWTQLDKSGGLALHVAGDLPGLGMECWAIRK